MNNGITVLISAWRAQDYIGECLESIVKQSCPVPFEVLLGIDGCKPTARWFNRVHPQVKCYWSMRNVGNYLIYNSLMKYAENDYVCIFGADDIMFPGFIEYHYKIREHGRITTSGYDCLNQNQQTIFKTKGFIAAIGQVGFYVSDVKQFGLFSPWRCAADSEFIGRMHRNGIRRKYEKISCFIRRYHGDSITQSQDYGRKSDYRLSRIKTVEAMKRKQVKKIETKTVELIPIREAEL